MTKEKLRDLINEVGKEIQDKLTPLSYRKTRNAYAHIYGMIKEITGTTYSESNPDLVISILEIIRNQPNISHDDLRKQLE